MPKPLVPDDDDLLDELPPLDDGDEAREEGFEEPLDALDDEDDRDDEEAGELGYDEGIDELADGDGEDASDADVGEDEIDEDPHTLSREDAEPPGVGDESFGLADAPPLDADDGGAEGTFDDEPPADALPALDGDAEDGDGDAAPDIEPLPPLRRAPLPPWQDAAWDRVPGAVSPPAHLGDAGTARAVQAGESGIVVAVTTRPARLLLSHDGGASWSTREIVLDDGEPIDLVDPRIAIADEAVAIVDSTMGVLVARGLDAPFVLVEGASGATAVAFLGASIDAPLAFAISGDEATPAYLARVLDDGSAALIAEIPGAGSERVDALAWDAASSLLWGATSSGPMAFRPPR